MRLSKIKLENFRCFDELEFNLHPRLTVIVGRNGSGKTALLDAIAIGLSTVVRGLSSANKRLSGKSISDTDFRMEKGSARGGGVKWSVTNDVKISVFADEGLAWDVMRRNLNSQPAIYKAESRRKAANLADALLTKFERINSGEPEPMPVFAYYGAQRGHIEFPRRLHQSRISYDYPTSALIDCMDAHGNFREMLQWFDMEEVAELRANKDVGSNESSVALSCVRQALIDVLGEDYSNPRFTKDRKFVVDASVGPSPLNVSQLSQGYQSVLALTMDFARRLAIGNKHLRSPGAHGEYYKTIKGLLKLVKELNPEWGESTADVLDKVLTKDVYPLLAPGIMLVDEIDLHLHPSWQQRVLSDLMSAFPTTQFIVTTHSPQVLSTVPAECIRVMESDLDEVDGVSSSIAEVKLQTEGVGSAEILANVMGIDSVPDVKASRMLTEYIGLIQSDEYEGERAADVRTYLLQHFGPDHPLLVDCNRLIRLKELKRHRPVFPAVKH